MKGLTEHVFDKEDLEVIENVRTVLDFETKVKIIKEKGPIEAAQHTVADFHKAALCIEPLLETKCSKEEFWLQNQLLMKTPRHW